MAARAAKTHTHLSNRAKQNEHTDRKTVFKSVLDNPFHIRWPSVSVNVQNSFLARVISLFEDISTYQSSRGQELRKRKKARRLQSSRERKKRKLEATFEDESPAAQTEASREPASPVAVDLGSPTTQAPAIMKHLTIGINQVTKKLESQVKAYRTTRVIAPDMQLEAAGSGCHVVVVLGCRADVDPPLLIAHLPHLVAAYNSSILSRPSSADSPLIKLVPLPKGAELLLAEALGLRRVAVVAFDSDTPELASFGPLLDSVPTLSAQWLTPSDDTQCKSLTPTHIKQVRTTAPKDMKAAKEKRAAGRAAAKDRAKCRSQKA